MKPIISLLLLSLLPLTGLRAKEPGTIYTKNGTREIMHLWVNGKYQGYLKPGETRVTVSDGFVTDDSARPTDSGERTPVKESHGGWTNDHNETDEIEVQTQTPSQGSPITNTLQADENGVIRWTPYNWSDRNAKRPAVPTDLECENAPAIRKGSKADIKRDGNAEEQPSPAKSEKKKPAAVAMTEANLVGSWQSPPFVSAGETTTMTMVIRGDGTIKEFYTINGNTFGDATWRIVGNKLVKDKNIGSFEYLLSEDGKALLDPNDREVKYRR